MIHLDRVLHRPAAQVSRAEVDDVDEQAAAGGQEPPDARERAGHVEQVIDGLADRHDVERAAAEVVPLDEPGDRLQAEPARLVDFERRRVGKEKWRERVLDALEAFEQMVLPDHVYLGGGNAKRLDPDTIGPNRTIVPNVSGLLGGIALWERTEQASVGAPVAAVRS